jgi:hypothetical protein
VSNEPHHILSSASEYQIRRATEAIKQLDIAMLIELERIKRPSTPVVQVAHMLCMYVTIFSDRHSQSLDIEQITSWAQLQEHISQISKYFFEL